MKKLITPILLATGAICLNVKASPSLSPEKIVDEANYQLIFLLNGQAYGVDVADHAIFPETMLSTMYSQGYTGNSGSDWLGYVYPL